MSRYPPWTPRRAARLGYLAGRGLPAETIGNDTAVAARSLRSLYHVATRWGIPLGSGSAGTVALPDDVRRGLDRAARARWTTVESLALMVLRKVAHDGLVDAVIDGNDRS